MRWRGVGDGYEEREGRGEMGVADSAGELKEGTVGADEEHTAAEVGKCDDRSQRPPACHQSGIGKKTA